MGIAIHILKKAIIWLWGKSSFWWSACFHAVYLELSSMCCLQKKNILFKIEKLKKLCLSQEYTRTLPCIHKTKKNVVLPLATNPGQKLKCKKKRIWLGKHPNLFRSFFFFFFLSKTVGNVIFLQYLKEALIFRFQPNLIRNSAWGQHNSFLVFA